MSRLPDWSSDVDDDEETSNVSWPIAKIRHFVVLFRPSMSRVAFGLHMENTERFVLCPVEEKYFDDGNPDLHIPNLNDLEGKRVLYLADWSSSQDKYIDYCCMFPVVEKGPLSLTVFLPFMGSATMERESVPGMVSTANVESGWLSSLCRASVRLRVVTLDLHTIHQQFYFSKDVVVKMESTIPYALTRIPDLDNTVIVFPDAGARTRFSRYFEERFRMVFCYKERKGTERLIKISDYDAFMPAPGQPNPHVLIVDDLVRSGGTLLECAAALKQLGGVNTVRVYVAHACFPRDEFRRFLPGGDGAGLVDHFYTSSTVAKTAEKLFKHKDLFTVFPLEDIIQNTV